MSEDGKGLLNLGIAGDPRPSSRLPAGIPGVAEWLLSLAATALVGVQMLEIGAAIAPQTGVRYYFEQTGAWPLHIAAMSLNLAVLVIVMTWMFMPRIRVGASRALMILAVLVPALAWIELVRAAAPVEGAIYSLNELPFRPINNFGPIGAQVFLTYVIAKLPAKGLPMWMGVSMRLALAICVWAAQMAAWNALARS